MTHLTDQELLREYTENRSEPAFAELVRRHVDLVYSAALRMVCDSHLAQDVTQGVFVALAKNAAQLADRPVLSGWLHRTASNIAAQTVRTEVRRHAREQEAAVMNELLSAEPEIPWEHIAPELDAALGELSEPDRDAVMLRYFERKSAAEMAQALGVSAEAAQKRVGRAVERLRESFASRGIAVGTGGLAVVISTNAVEAAPVGLALTVTTTALAGTAVFTTATTTATTAIVMTTLQKAIIAASITVAAGAIGTGFYEARQVSNLNKEVTSLRQERNELAPLQARVDKLQRERDDATNRLATVIAENEALKKRPGEVLKLRGEVGQLRQENTAIKSASAINKITGNPETRKLMRDQQKAGMARIFKNLTKTLNLTPEQTERFNEMLADNIMDGVDRVTEALRDKTTGAELDRIFAGEEGALLQKIQEQFGAEAAAQYKKYNGDLVNTLTVEQFASELTGDKAAKDEKKKQLLQVMQEETRRVMAEAGLPEDYQALPILNFRNIASEEEENRTLKLMGDIYDRVIARADTFLKTEEVQGLRQFKTNALANSHATLLMNRKVMAPISQ